MLYGIMNEQGNCHDVRDDVSKKKYYFSHVSYKSLTLASDALILIIIVIADNKAMNLCYRCYI